MIIDPMFTEIKLQTYLRAAKKQQKYVDMFSPVYCTDTMFNYYDCSYTGLNSLCNSTFDPRTDPLYAKDLTREELIALTDQEYFSVEELKYYFDLLISHYCLSDPECIIKEDKQDEKENHE